MLDGIAAEPETREPAEGNEQASGEANQGSENAPHAPSGTGVPGHMSHAEQLAQANWTAAIMKVDELKPKSYKDYIRALKTYKVRENVEACFVLLASALRAFVRVVRRRGSRALEL